MGVLRLGGWSPHVQTGFLVSRPTRGPARSCTHTGLSPTMARLSRRFWFLLTGHWPGPRSLVATSGVSVDVLSSGYLDISVRRVRFYTLCIQVQMTPKGRVSPFGHLGINTCLSAPPSISQTTTSFIASNCLRQGIHQMLFSRLIELPS